MVYARPSKLSPARTIPGENAENHLCDAFADSSGRTMSILKSLVDPTFNEDDVTILLVTRIVRMQFADYLPIPPPGVRILKQVLRRSSVCYATTCPAWPRKRPSRRWDAERASGTIADFTTKWT